MGSKALEGVGVGATVGVVAAAIAAIGTSLTIPGLGIIVADPLAAAFTVLEQELPEEESLVP